MAGSVARVEAALAAAGAPVEIRRTPTSTRTAAEAAAACGCSVGAIVKSLIFQGAETGALSLLLVSGDRRVDPEMAAAVVGEPLTRADPKDVRRLTGFAIGGVAPVGSLSPVPVWFDESLLAHAVVWAAAGAPDAVFRIAPGDLLRISGARAAAFAVLAGD